MRIDDLDTPFLLVHLDALEANLDRAQAYCDENHIGLRPHIKTHKCLAISRMQIDRGAIGIVCQKLGEAEVMVDGGVDRDVLIPYNLVGRIKLERLAALAGLDLTTRGSGASGRALSAGISVFSDGGEVL